MHFLTDFGDQAVVLPLAFSIALALALAGWRRGAAAWLIVIAATLLVMLLGKMVVFACGPLPQVGLKSPSGHTASAAVACGGLAALLAPHGWRPPLLAAIAALAAAALIGGSRVALGAHSHADVVAGAMVGIAGAILLARLAGDRPADLRRLLPLAVAFAVVMLFHGVHLNAENDIAHFSYLFWPLTLCR